MARNRAKRNKKWDISLAISKKCITFATQMKIVLWCNGSTPDSGSVCEGSNPSRTTKVRVVISHEIITFIL